jgi:hypothetical protein
MFPGSPLWYAPLEWRSTIRLILTKESQNLPKALKELTIQVTPGGLLAMILTLLLMRGGTPRRETQLIWIASLDAAILVIAYCMLVFDSRYVLPLVPLLMAVAVPFVVPGQETQPVSVRFPNMRAVTAVLLLFSTIFFQVYWASPFRSLRRDYELSCYDAAQKLRTIPNCARLVVIGHGPYPEHGVGWEAGIYASYFARCHMVAFRSDIPSHADIHLVLQDLFTISPDAILLFGAHGNSEYESLGEAIQRSNPAFLSQTILDPEAGEVGKLLWSGK